MAYTVNVGGVLVTCETAAEAIELARVAGGQKPGKALQSTQGSQSTNSGSRWTEQRIRDFFRVIKAQQRKLVEAMLETPDALTAKQLCTLLQLEDGRALAGVFAGLWKNADKVGADPKDLYERSMVTRGDKRENDYTLTESFRAAAQKWKP